MANIFPAGDAQYSTNLGLSLWGADSIVVENFLAIDAAYGTSLSIKINGSVIPPTPNFVNSATVTFSVTGSTITATAAAGSGNATSIQGTPVSSTAPTTGQVLEYNGTNYVPATVQGASYYYDALSEGFVTTAQRTIRQQ
jgi:hypothetical protein